MEKHLAGNGNGSHHQLDLDNAGYARLLIGERGANMKLLEKLTGAEINARGNRLLVGGPDDAAALAMRSLRQLYGLVEQGFPVAEADIHKAVDMLKADAQAQVKEVFMETISIPSARRQISPRSPAQKPTSSLFEAPIWSSLSDRRVQARPTWPLPWLCRRSSTGSSSALSWPGRPWRRARSSAFCLETLRNR